MTKSRWTVCRVRNLSDRSCRENQNTHIFCVQQLLSENRAFYKIMYKNEIEPERPQLALYVIRRMRLACCISTATRLHAHAHAPVKPLTHTRAVAQTYVILIPSPRQQWLRERSSMSRSTYTVYLVHNSIFSLACQTCERGKVFVFEKSTS